MTRNSSLAPSRSTRAWILLPLLAGSALLSASPARAQDSAPRPAIFTALAALEASPQVLAGRGAAAVTLRLAPGVVPPPNARIGVFMAGTNARLTELSRPFVAGPNGLQATLSLDAEPGLYDIRLLRGDKSRAPLTQSARISVVGIDREPGWWLFNGSPILRAATTNAAPVAGVPFFLPTLKRSLSKSDKTRSANTGSNSVIGWRTLAWPSLAEWLRDANAARESALGAARQARAAGQNGLAGCEMRAVAPNASASSEDARALATADPQAIVRAVQAARAAATSIAPEAALILSLPALPPALAARVVDLAAPECDAVHIDGFGSADAAALWPLKAARRVAEEQPEFDLPIFVTPRDVASGMEAWMGGATGVIAPGGPNATAQVLAETELSRAIESNLSLFVGSVTLEDSGLLRAGVALSLFRRMREIGRVPLLARTLDVASRRDRSNREGRRNAESFALRWTRGTPPSDLLGAIRDATRDGSRVYLEGNPFPLGQEAPVGFDATAWRDLFQASVRPIAGASQMSVSALSASDYAAEDAEAASVPRAPSGAVGRASELKLDDIWTFGLARGQSVVVEQSISATPLRTPEAWELGDASPPKGQSERERERIRPAPRVAATLADGSPGTLISPGAGSPRREFTGATIPRGEVVWTPHLLPSLPSLAGASTSTSRSLAVYDASISTLLQPALVRLFEREGGPAGVVSISSLPEALGVRVCVRATTRGTLLLALVNPLNRPRAISVQTQAAGGYALDLVQNRVLPTRTRALRVEMDVDIPANGFRLLAIAEDAKKFEADRDTRRLKARAR